MASPPPFADLANCAKCDSGFGLFVRKHHCRNCGQTFCSTCSSKSASLPHFNIAELVRVCDACFDKLSRPAAPAPKAPRAAQPEAPRQSAADAVLATPTVVEKPKKVVQKVCVCGLPICICPDPAEEAPEKVQEKEKPVPTPSKPKPATTPARTTFSSFSSASSLGGSNSSKLTIDWSGDLAEQCRDAIKQGDSAAAMQLLDKVPCNWIDRQGQSLLHLACMFNRTGSCFYCYVFCFSLIIMFHS
jgi:hypothetical protein